MTHQVLECNREAKLMDRGRTGAALSVPEVSRFAYPPRVAAISCPCDMGEDSQSVPGSRKMTKSREN